MMARAESGDPMVREQALHGRPVRIEPATAESTGDGGIRVTVALPRPRWHRWFGGSGDMPHSFDLDAFGREVYDACDGQCDVAGLVRQFAERHSISAPEAEISVTAFLKLLMSRGLIAMTFAE